MRALEGIEPPTRGFSVAGTAAPDVRKSKTRWRFYVGGTALSEREHSGRRLSGWDADKNYKNGIDGHIDLCVAEPAGIRRTRVPDRRG